MPSVIRALPPLLEGDLSAKRRELPAAHLEFASTKAL
jgi:hypothetical protein